MRIFLSHMRWNHRSALAAGLIAATALAAPVSAETVTGPFNDPEPSFAGSYLAGRSASFDHDLNAAIGFFDTALALAPDDANLVERTFLLRLAGGEIEGALALTDQLIAEQSEHSLSRLARTAAAMKRGDYADALAELNAMGPNQLTDLTSALIGAWADQGAGNTDAALARVDEISGPEWFEIFKNYHAGLIADLAGRPQEAIEYLTKAQEVDNSALRVAEAYARLQARAGNKDAALAALADYVNHSQQLRGEIAAGEKPAPPVRSAVEGAAEVFYGIGALIGADGADDLASTYLQLAIYLNGASDVALVSLGDLLQRTGRYDEAINNYRKIGPDSPMYDRAKVQIGITQELKGDSDAAMATLKKVVAEEPDNLDAITALSNLQRSKDMFLDSAETLTKGLATISTPTESHWRLFYFRGIDYERTKQWPLAEADFKKALELNPDQPQVLNYLGYSWVDMGTNLDEALEMIRKAVDLSQNDGYIVDSLGWAYYRLGRYDEAVTELERAVELKPDDPVINDHLGDAYWKVGRRRQAYFQWSHALDFDPEEDAKPTIVAKLEKGLQEPPTATDATPAPKAAAPEPTPEKIAAVPPAPTIPETIEVAPGDSLWSLAKKYYGDPESYRIIYDANRDRIDDPDVIIPGMMLTLPKAAATN